MTFLDHKYILVLVLFYVGKYDGNCDTLIGGKVSANHYCLLVTNATQNCVDLIDTNNVMNGDGIDKVTAFGVDRVRDVAYFGITKSGTEPNYPRSIIKVDGGIILNKYEPYNIDWLLAGMVINCNNSIYGVSGVENMIYHNLYKIYLHDNGTYTSELLLVNISSNRGIGITYNPVNDTIYVGTIRFKNNDFVFAMNEIIIQNNGDASISNVWEINHGNLDWKVVSIAYKEDNVFYWDVGANIYIMNFKSGMKILFKANTDYFKGLVCTDFQCKNTELPTLSPTTQPTKQTISPTNTSSNGKKTKVLIFICIVIPIVFISSIFVYLVLKKRKKKKSKPDIYTEINIFKQ